ncbi:MAG: DNA polymerase Y family protein [Acidobacteriota bacterium]|jgi:protein ImuB|nr:DNA polymerase Y family protein [Acidobacteriota bacterium]
MTRIACLFIPLFPLAARLRAEPELAGEAVAVCEGNGSAARVVGASRPARKSGVRSEMSLAQARGILPSLIARGRDVSCETSAHEALVETATGLSPRVEDAAPDIVFADVGGMERLFEGDSGEHDMGQAAIVAAEALDLPVRVGIAGNKLAARIAARMPDSPKVVAAGKEMLFLAPLPLAHLHLDRRLMDTLRRWGVRTLGDFARLPADRTASRLGPAGVSAHQAARGIDSSPLAPYHPPPTFHEGMELEWPVVTVDPLLYALRQSLERTRKRLEREDLACALLELELGLEPEGAEHRRIRLPAPTRDVDALLALTRLELESKPPRAPVVAFISITHPDRPRRGQITLFGAPEIHPDKLAGTLAHLAARLGPERVGSPRTIDGHLPERFQTEPFNPPPAPKLRQSSRQGRGLLVVRVLRPPVPIEVITETNEELGIRNEEFPTAPPKIGAIENYPIPKQELSVAEGGRGFIPNSEFLIPNSGPLGLLRLVSVASEAGATPRIQGLVRVTAGPWALEDGWWNNQPVERDYWDVELSGGGLYRVYRDRKTGDWFADGMYD